MTLFRLPVNELHSVYLYNQMMVFTMIGTAMFWSAASHWGLALAWVPFVVSWFWSGIFFWDMYVRPWLMPYTEMPEEDILDRRLNEFLSGQSAEVRDNVTQMEHNIQQLKERVDELEAD